MQLLSARCPKPPGKREILYELRSGESLNSMDQLFYLVHWLDIFPKLRERQSTNWSSWKKINMGGFHWLSFIRGGNLGEKIFWLLMLKNWKIWRHWNIFQNTECTRTLDNPKRWRICISCGRWFSKIIREKTTNSKNPLWDGNPPWGERTSAENLMAIGKSFNLKKQKMTKESIRIFGLTQKLGETFEVIMLNQEVQLHLPRKESCPIPLSSFDVTRSTYADLETVQEKKFVTIRMSTRTEICQIRGRSFTRIALLNETPLKGKRQSGRGGKLTRIQTTSRPDHIWPDALTTILKAAQRRKKQE